MRFYQTMFKKKIILLIGGILLLFNAAHTQILTKAQWQEDLDYLYNTLISVHPAPFHRVLPEVYQQKKEALEQQLNQLTDQEIVVKLMEIATLPYDGHTGLTLSGKVLNTTLWYPIRMERFEEGVYVVSVGEEKYKDLLGAKVIGIGERSIEDVWAMMQANNNGDNVFCSMSRVPLDLSMADLLKGYHLIEKEELTLKLQLPSGEGKTVSVLPVNIPQGIHIFFGSNYAVGSAPTSLPTGKQENWDLSFQHSKNAYWYQVDASSGLLYAQVNQILNAEQPVWLNGEEKKASLLEFTKAIIQEFDNGKATKLVLDLRKNGGGNNFLARPVVNLIANHTQINQRGKLFIITGRLTYSAAMNFTSMLEDRTQAIFAGEPAGGSPLHYGDATSFKLPHSEMNLRVSTLRWDLGVHPGDVREAMECDLPIPPSFSAFKEGKDPVLEAIRKYKPGDILSDGMLQAYENGGIEAALNFYKNRKRYAAPWDSKLQQLLAFGEALIPKRPAQEVIGQVVNLLMQEYPNSFEMWYELADFNRSQGNWKQAAQLYQRSLSLRPAQPFIKRMYEIARRK